VDSNPVKIFTGSITDSDLVSEACKGVNAVLHIASVIDTTMFTNDKLLKDVNIKGISLKYVEMFK
jgi:nucleoside-diphosphate-sugar epimerase